MRIPEIFSRVYQRGKSGLTLFPIFLLVCAAGCASVEVASRWPDQKMLVDGNNSEWNGKTILLEDRKLTVGIMNDSSFVYMMVATNDRQLSRNFVNEGLTVWFDNQGGRDHTFGIHYPIGLSSVRSSRSGENDRAQSTSDALLRSNSPLAELELLGPGTDDRHRMSIVAAGSLQARINYGDGSFVYELRVPYVDDSRFPFTLRSKHGSILGVGLETSGTEMTGGTRDGGSGGMGGGGGRGRGGRGGGGSPGSDQGAGREIIGPIKDWMKVQLISPDSVRTR